MNHSGLSALGTQRVEVPINRRRPSALAQRRELEGKLTALQKDYAELHAEIGPQPIPRGVGVRDHAHVADLVAVGTTDQAMRVH